MTQYTQGTHGSHEPRGENQDYAKD